MWYFEKCRLRQACAVTILAKKFFVLAEIILLAANFVLAEIFELAENFVLSANFVLAGIFVPAANFVLAAIFLLAEFFVPAANFVLAAAGIFVFCLFCCFTSRSQQLWPWRDGQFTLSHLSWGSLKKWLTSTSSWERECLTRDRVAAGSSPTGDIALCP